MKRRPRSQSLPADAATKVRRVMENETETADDETIDLVYPFDTETAGGGGTGGGSGGGGTCQCQQIAVDTTGPLHLSNNVLTLNTTAPIVTLNRSLALSVAEDSAIRVDGNRKLDLRVDPNGPILAQREISLSTKPPISVEDKFLKLSIDPSVMALSGNNLTLQTSAPLIKKQGGIGLDTDGSMHLSSGKLSIKLAPESGISNTSDGILVNVDNVTLRIVDNVLQLNKDSYLSPYITFEVGHTDLNNASAHVCCEFGSDSKTSIWNVGYYIYMVYSAGLVHGIITTKLEWGKVSQISGQNSLRTGINFTFVLSVMGVKDFNTNISYLTDPVVTPPGNNWHFVPEDTGGTYGALPSNQVLNSTFTNWYKKVSLGNMILHYYTPMGTGSDFGTSVCGAMPASVTDHDGQVLGNVMCFTFNNIQTGGSNWFETSMSNNHHFTTGQIPFSYKSQDR